MEFGAARALYSRVIWPYRPDQRALLFEAFALAALHSQGLTAEQRQLIDEAIPRSAPVRPKKRRTILVTNLSMRDGKPARGSSYATHPASNYALEQMGKTTGAFEAVVSSEPEMLSPANLRRFDALCFNNTVGVLFEDPQWRESLLDFIAGGKGFVGIHDAIATFVQYPKYDQWPAFGKMLGATENGGHPWNGEEMTIAVEDAKSPLTAMFGGRDFQVADQAFQFQEPVLRDHLHVLLRIDVEKTGLAPKRRILPVRQQDMDFPVSWIRRYQKGRIFYCGLGHGPQIFRNGPLLAHLLAGIQYATGDLKADDRPTPKPG